MYRICENGFKESDLEYFGSNVKQEDLSGCFRLAVQWDNYDVSDYIISQGYRVKNDLDVITDILYYVDREMFEKIEYLVYCGFLLNEKVMIMLMDEYYLYKHYHQDNGFLLKIMGLYGRCCGWEKEG